METTDPTEVMMQSGDDKFIDPLNHVWTAELDTNDVSLLKSKLVKPSDTCPKDTLHIFCRKCASEHSQHDNA